MTPHCPSTLAALLTIGLLSSATASAQQLFTSNEALSASQLLQPRPLNYWPDGEAVVTVNGANRFTRALYGGASAFRLETSDRPEFGLFMPYMGGNILIDTLFVAGGATTDVPPLAFSSGEVDVEARYEAGCRVYVITLPPRFRRTPSRPATLRITAAAMERCDAAAFEVAASDNVRPGTTLRVRYGAASNASFSRNGDMGVDKKDCFDFSIDKCAGNAYTVDGATFHLDYGQKSKRGAREMVGHFSPATRLDVIRVAKGGGESCAYLVAAIPVAAKRDKATAARFVIGHPALSKAVTDSGLEAVVTEAIGRSAEKAAAVVIETPDAAMNTLGPSLSMAADGIWGADGVWQHGAIGWRMPLPGWRAAYVGDVVGWHDRARIHFDNYAASQLTEVAVDPTLPMMDSARHLARGLEQKGTPMYSTGYICRLPRDTRRVNHYDMNLVYVDELLWHFRWTGDWAYVYDLWPVVSRHLDWEKRNFDPDGDHLYDAYCCIWASDGLYYSGGAVTHSSAYNYRANAAAAEIAARFAAVGSYERDGQTVALTDDEIRSFRAAAAKYGTEARAILAALNDRLWMADEGVWAECQDALGLRRLHRAPALWTVYHAIDSDVATPEQADRAVDYVESQIPHIPVCVDTERVPVRRTDEGATPAPIAEAEALISDIANGHYATVATTSWQPYGWSINNVAHAEVAHTALAFWQAGRRDDAFRLLKAMMIDGMYLGHSPGNFGQISFYDAARSECYRDFGDPVGIASRAIVQGLFGVRPDRLNSRIRLVPGFPSDWDHARLATADFDFAMRRDTLGHTSAWSLRMADAFRADTLALLVPMERSGIGEIRFNGSAGHFAQYGTTRTVTDGAGNAMLEITVALPAAVVQTGKGKELYAASATVEVTWIGEEQTVRRARRPAASPASTGSIADGRFADVDTARIETVNLTPYYNESVTGLFRQEYLSPRWPTTTLAMPTQGIGEWCHPLDTFHVDDSGLRHAAAVGSGVIRAVGGVPFATPAAGHNVLFTSRWDNFPTAAAVPIAGKASHVYLMLSGTTNAMQCRIDNGVIRVRYADGTADSLALVNPINWWPIDQDLLQGLPAYYLTAPDPSDTPPPYRFALRTATPYRPQATKLNTPTDGGAATLLDLPINADKELLAVEVETLSNDVVIGLMALSLQR